MSNRVMRRRPVLAYASSNQKHYYAAAIHWSNTQPVEEMSTYWDYDKWAIKWGYSYFPAKTAKEEKGILNEMTKEAYKTVAFGLELKLVHTIHVIKQRILR
jgi:hypothetical protein